MTKKYYVTSIDMNTERGTENKSVPSTFDNLDKAKAKYYSTLASDINAVNVTEAIVMMWDNNGNIVMSEHWKKEVEPEEVQESDNVTL